MRWLRSERTEMQENLTETPSQYTALRHNYSITDTTKMMGYNELDSDR